MIATVASTLLGLALVAAALCDLRWRLIPDWVSLLGLALWLVCGAAEPASHPWWSSLAAGLLVLAGGSGLFALGWLGGGDVKLASMCALWVGWPELPLLLLTIALFGGVVALLVLGHELVRRGLARWRGRPPVAAAPTVPYGMAIAAGSLLFVIEHAARQPG